MMHIVIYPYRKFSASAKLLAKILNAKLRYKPQSKWIINWGNHVDPGKKMLNAPYVVDIAADKLATFQHLKNVATVPWTIDKKEADEWLKEGKKVVARTLLRASEGRGAVVVEPGGTLPSSRLFTQYVPKKKEFRVHVVCGSVIDVQEKRKKQGEDSSPIRSHDHGYVFCRENIVEPKDLRPLALLGVKSLGLDFGAVDVIWNEKQNKCFLLEINTAPGLTDTTARAYATAFKHHFSNK